MNARNGLSDTPIHHAAQNGNQACAAALLQHGANIRAAGSFGFCVAHYATSKGHLEVLRYLLQNGADPNAISASRDTPGHIAAREKNMGCLKALHEAGADLRVHNSKFFLYRCPVLTGTTFVTYPIFPSPHSTSSSLPLHILTVTPTVAGQTPANIAESRSNEEMMVWMREQGIF